MWCFAYNRDTVFVEMNTFELNGHSYLSRPKVLRTYSAERKTFSIFTARKSFQVQDGPDTLLSQLRAPAFLFPQGLEQCLARGRFLICLKQGRTQGSKEGRKERKEGRKGGRKEGRKEKREERNSFGQEYLLQGRHGQSEQSSLCGVHLRPPLPLFSCTLGCQNSCFWCSSASSFSRSGSHSCTEGLLPPWARRSQ